MKGTQKTGKFLPGRIPGTTRKGTSIISTIKRWTIWMAVAVAMLVGVSFFAKSDYLDFLVATKLGNARPAFRQSALRAFLENDVYQILQDKTARPATVISQLSVLQRPPGGDFFVFDSTGRALFSTRSGISVGSEYGEWSTGDGLTLRNRLDALAQGGITVSDSPLQGVQGWEPGVGTSTFMHIPGTKFFVLGRTSPLVFERNSGTANVVSNTRVLWEAVAWSLGAAGLVLWMGFLLARQVKKLCYGGIESTAAVIKNAINTGEPINQSGIACVEFAMLVDEIDAEKDITALYASEQEVVRAEKTVREVLNSVYDAVLVVGEDAKVAWVNRRMEQMFEVPRSQACQMALWEFSAIAEDAVFIQENIHAVSQGETRMFEWRCHRIASGVVFPVEVFAQRVNIVNSKVICVSIRDVTDAKSGEQALCNALEALSSAKEQADLANRAKSDFLARMSHEIRTPMNAIIGIAYLAQRTTTDNASQASIQKIHYFATSLLRIINDVLDFSKIEAGKVCIEPQPFAINDLCSVISDIASVRSLNKSIRFDIQIADDVPPVVCSDSLRLQQILTNLVENAIKFTNVGNVFLRISNCDEGQGLRFEVEDQGIGISAEQLARLFHSFEQADESIVRRFGGTGLGLAICKRLVQLMGGTIGVESELGRGSMFWFQIPLGQISSKVLEHHSHMALDLQEKLAGKRVLVVDDNEINREIASEMTREAGCDVEAVSGGEEALKFLNSSKWDLVLLDLEMPGMDGFETARCIRTAPDTERANVPILCVSAHNSDELRSRAFEMGMNGYLMKPIEVRLLHAELLRYLTSPQNPKAIQASPQVRMGEPTILDADKALRMLNNNQKLYKKLVIKFQNDWSDIDTKISELIEHDPSDALRLAHNLKGMSSSLGCTILAQCSEKMEKALRVDEIEDALALLPILRDALHESLVELDAWVRKQE